MSQPLTPNNANEVKNDDGSKIIRVFILKNTAFITKSIELYLERREFSVQVETEVDTDFEKLLKKIDDFKPDYILLPWDHKDPNMRNVLSLIDSNKTPCIPYITSTATQDSRALMVVNSPYKLFPPISGPSIQRMILKIEKSRVQKNQKEAGHSKKNEAQNQVYIAKGKRAGDLKKDYQKILNSQSESALQADKKEGLDQTTAASTQHQFDSITDLTTPIPISDFSPRMQLKISEVQKRSLAYKFDSRIQKNLIEFIETLKAENNTTEKINIYGLLLQSVDSSGLILFYSKWKIEIDEAEVFMQDWSNDLLSHFLKGDGINFNNYQSQVFEIDLAENLNILDICQTKSAIYKAIDIDGKLSVMAFFDLKHNPFNVETALDDNYFIIDVNCLVVPSMLPMDLYFEMKQNRKMLKVYKIHSELSEQEINTIHQKKLLPLLVDSSDEITWYKYGVESFLKK